jgi:hypothetical protein
VADGNDAADKRLDERGEGAAEQERDGHVEHPALAAGDLAEDGDGDHRHAAQELVGGAKQRPDVEVAAKGERQAADQRDDGCEPGVADDLHDAGLLGAHGDGVVGLGRRTPGRRARAMRATASREVRARAETHMVMKTVAMVALTPMAHALGDAGGEDLERGGGDARVEGTVAGGVHVLVHDGGNDDGEHADKGLEDHGAIADGERRSR